MTKNKTSSKKTTKQTKNLVQENSVTENTEPTPVSEPVKQEEQSFVKASPAEFDPKKLRGIGPGAWIYTDDVKKISRTTFHQAKAKDYGIKENDVVFVVSNGKVETLGV